MKKKDKEMGEHGTEKQPELTLKGREADVHPGRLKFLNERQSGVATGWHGWTMSRGPGAKEAPERLTIKMKNRKGKKKKKKKKKKRKKGKERTKLLKYPDGAPFDISS